jgi:hypothetical protein
MRLVAAPDGRDGAVSLHQDARLFIANLGPGERADYQVGRDHGIWNDLWIDTYHDRKRITHRAATPLVLATGRSPASATFAR